MYHLTRTSSNSVTAPPQPGYERKIASIDLAIFFATHSRLDHHVQNHVLPSQDVIANGFGQPLPRHFSNFDLAQFFFCETFSL